MKKGMIYIYKVSLIIIVLISLLSNAQDQKIPAFPGAEGVGMYASGGRGGEIYIVKNLNADGPGSLQEAVSGSNRFVIFAVSGTIDLIKNNKTENEPRRENQKSVDDRIKEIYDQAKKEGHDEAWIQKKVERAKNSKQLADEKKEASQFSGGNIVIDYPNITIAGQTAPGEGITIIHGGVSINASNVIIRYIRVRRGFIGAGQSGDGFTVKGKKEVIHDVILDHCSSAWTTDENITMTGNVTNGTVQYSIAAEGLDYFNFGQTPPRHSEGSLFGSTVPGGIVSFHHIIYANNRLRNPRVTGGNLDPPAVHDLRNCIISNWVENSSHTGSGGAALNLVNNYYKYGVNTWTKKQNEIFEFKQVRGPMWAYISGNMLAGNEEVTLNNWKGTHDSNDKTLEFDSNNKFDNGKNVVFRMNKAFDTPYVTTKTAQEAYEICLDDAGATIPSRDYVDFRIVRDIRYGAGRVINTEEDLPEDKRWPTVWSLTAPADIDEDGLPDYWEEQYGLANNKRNDADDIDNDGYSNIEEYVNNSDPVGGEKNIVFISTPVSRANKYEYLPGVIKVTREGQIGKEIVVEYSVSGSAIKSEDYKKLSNKIVIPAKSKSALIEIMPLLKNKTNMGTQETFEDKSVVITLQQSGSYNIGCPQKAMVVIKEY